MANIESLKKNAIENVLNMLNTNNTDRKFSDTYYNFYEKNYKYHIKKI